MPYEASHQTRVSRVDRLPRGPPRHGRERDQSEIPRCGDDDVRRLLRVIDRAGVSPERRARDPSRHPSDPGRRGEERAEGAPVLDMGGRALHLGVLAHQLLNEAFERLAIPLREHRAGALPVVGEHDEAIGPRRVLARFLDDPDDLVKPRHGIARFHAIGPGVMRDLVVIDEVRIDRRGAAPHLLDHEGGAEMAQEHVRRRARERIGKAPRPARLGPRRRVFLSHQRNPGIPSLFPWRMPAWLADVCVGSSGCQGSRLIAPELSQRARCGVGPARRWSSRIGCASPSICMNTTPGGPPLMSFLRRRASSWRTRVPKNEWSSPVHNTAFTSAFTTEKITEPTSASTGVSTAIQSTPAMSQNASACARTVTMDATAIETCETKATSAGRRSVLIAARANAARTPDGMSRSLMPGRSHAVTTSTSMAMTNVATPRRATPPRPPVHLERRRSWAA